MSTIYGTFTADDLHEMKFEFNGKTYFASFTASVVAEDYYEEGSRDCPDWYEISDIECQNIYLEYIFDEEIQDCIDLDSKENEELASYCEQYAKKYVNSCNSYDKEFTW